MTRAEMIRVLRLEAALASCQNAREALLVRIAQLRRTAKVKAGKVRR